VKRNSPGRPPKSASGAGKASGSKAAVKSENGCAGADDGKRRAQGRGHDADVIEITSDEEDLDAASGYTDSEAEGAEVELKSTPGGRKTAAGASAAKAMAAKNGDSKKQSASAKKASPSRAAEKEAPEAGEDQVTAGAGAHPDEDAFLCTKNGRGLDGPKDIVLPGEDCSSWSSKDFCLLVDNRWRRDRSFQLLEVDAKSRKVLERAGGSEGGGGECRVMARLWYCSKELEPKGGFETGKHGFLPFSKGFRTWVLPGSSWLPVVAVQKTRVQVENDYKDSDEGILSLKKGELATASGEEANGWANIRTDSGQEGWFPASYIKALCKYVELEEEEDKVIVAYNHLPTSRQRGGSSGRGNAGDEVAAAKSKPPSKNEKKTPQKALSLSKGGRGGGGEVEDRSKSSSKKSGKERAKTPVLEDWSDTEEEKKEYSRRNRKITDRFSPTWEEMMDEHGGTAADGAKRVRGASAEVETAERSQLRDKLNKLVHARAPADEVPSAKTPARDASSHKKGSTSKAKEDEQRVSGAASGEARGEVRRRRSGEQDGEPKAVCGVCFNPNKKMGNAKTIVLLCNRCEGLIKQGWPYWQHREPKQHQPGHAVFITNLCKNCFHQADQRDGFYEPQSVDDMVSAANPSASTPARGGSAGDASKSGVEAVVLPTAEFEERKVEQLPESVCNCQFCGQMYHERCVHYNPAIYGDIPPRCPNPGCEERWLKLHKPEQNLRWLQRRARDIPLTPVAESIQRYVEETVFKGKGGGKGHEDRVIVRTVSNVKRTQESTPGFTARYGKQMFPYRLKNIFAFTECDDHCDVSFLSLVVAEFGSDAPQPNKNKAYLSYVDSVHLYHQKSCLLRKTFGSALPTSTCSNPAACQAERKTVVRRIILGYLDSIRRRGFEALYIWVMPPNDLHHDYVFHMRPISQHCPKPCQLDAWYTKLLTVAKEEGIIDDFDSNAQDEEDPEQDRTLPASLFGPDQSLRHVPQFPGGLMLRALEVALLAGGSDAVSKAGLPRSPDRRRVSNSSLTSYNSASSPAVAGEGRSRVGTTLNRETQRHNSERQQRAVQAMQDYMQQNSDLGSVFVVQYHKDKDGSKDSKDPKRRSPAARGKGARVNAGSDALEDDPLVSIDDDDQSFTLNECAHLCALLNDLHLQFNDMRHGKYSTAAMVHLLMQNRKDDQPSGSAKADKKSLAAPQPVGVKGSLMAVAGLFKGFLTKKEGAGETKQEEGKGMSREARALMQQTAERGKGKYAVERHVDVGAEAAVGQLRLRQAENLQKGEVGAASHKCTSRCADGKCTKHDWDTNCPVQCSCAADVPPSYMLWSGEWCFCEWCCSWQHTCCMREHASVCYDESIQAREICYDTDFNYMCHLCSSMPKVLQMRSCGKARKPNIQRVQALAAPPLPPLSAKKTPAKLAASSIHSDSAASSPAHAAARGPSSAKAGGGASVKGSAVKGAGDGRGRGAAAAQDAGSETAKKKRRRKRCFSRGPKGRPKKLEEEDTAESSEDEGRARQRPKVSGGGKTAGKKSRGGKQAVVQPARNSKKRKAAELIESEEEEEEEEKPVLTSKMSIRKAKGAKAKSGHIIISRKHLLARQRSERQASPEDAGAAPSRRKEGGKAQSETRHSKESPAEEAPAKQSKGGRAGGNGSAAGREKQSAKLARAADAKKGKVHKAGGKKEEGPRQGLNPKQGLIEPGKNPRVCVSRCLAPCFVCVRARALSLRAGTVCVLCGARAACVDWCAWVVEWVGVM